MKNHLSTLLLSLLLCGQCLAQPDSRPGPYQATLSKINALLVTGAATVKEVEFTTDGSALASASKTQLYSDAANGNLFVNVPTGKYHQRRVAGTGLLNLGKYAGAQGDKYWAIGPWYGGDSVTHSDQGIMADTNHLYLNIYTSLKLHAQGVEKYRFAAALAEMNRLSLGGTIGSSVDPGAGGLGLTGQIIFAGAGTGVAATSQIYCDASAGNMYVNVPTSKTITLRVNGSNLYTFSTGLVLADTVNVVPGSTTGTKFGTATTNKMGFWNATPVVQPALTGTSTTLTTAGSTNALYADSTSTGGIGSTAYSLPDVVRNLKTAGLLAP